MLVVVGDDGDAEMAVLAKQGSPLNLGAHSVPGMTGLSLLAPSLISL